MLKWRCKVCGYIHEGDAPPETCPICGVDSSQFEKVAESIKTDDCQGAIKGALRQISYGLYIIASVKEGKLNGQCANTVFQITSDPAKIAIGINKSNLTHEYIEASRVFSVNILNTEGLELVKNFGFKSGRDADKFAGISYQAGNSGVPLLKNCLASLECKVVSSMDLGTHTLFIGEVVCATENGSGEPMTYALYHKLKNKPDAKAANKGVKKWRCKVCDMCMREKSHRKYVQFVVSEQRNLKRSKH